MGTSSVGWAVTDVNYQLIRKKGKDLWGVRLFDEAQSAEARRSKRTSRRRLQREKARIGYVKEIFADAIMEVDQGFLHRLEDSKYYVEDKREREKYILFTGKDYNDSHYYNQYPTIFHLRKELISSTEPHDVRLVFLAVLNIFKHRGHFLNKNLSNSEMRNFQEMYQELKSMLGEQIPSLSDICGLEKILTSQSISNSDRVNNILKLLGLSKTKDKSIAEIWKMICGLKGSVATIFPDSCFDEEFEKKKLSFSDENYEETLEKLGTIIDEESYELMLIMKRIYDWKVLASIMQGEEHTYSYLSESRISMYEKHKKDLKILKELYKSYDMNAYNKMFRIMEDYNYGAYVGSVNSNKEKARRGKKKVKSELYKLIKKDLTHMADSEKKEYVLEEIEKETFLPKQMTGDNGVIPNQLHKIELEKILENASKYLEFLNEKDESGLTATERILQMFEFQIPYYIGPLTSSMKLNENNCGHGWMIRREEGKIYPWNFEQKIDVKETAEKFIHRMVKHCTYLSGESVLPRNSLLYEKFIVLNELNNLKINGEPISVELKQELYHCLFKDGKKVTRKKLVNYLLKHAIITSEDVEIGGIDKEFISRRANYNKFKEVFQCDTLTYEQEQMAEKIIFWSTIYGDTKNFLQEKIEETYENQLSDSQMKRILGYKFRDWGRLSKEMLYLEGVDKDTGEVATILSRMWDSNNNFMQLIASERFSYKEEIEAKSKQIQKTLMDIEYEDLLELYVSPAVRRMIWQTMLILKEITKVMKTEPAKVFVEMTREHQEKGVTKDSRKEHLKQLYEACGKDGKDWVEKIAKYDEMDFRSKKLYLYYKQMGRCMYTGEEINMDELFKDNRYDIDHIYPRHFVKDDSIENNLVLVKKQKNAHKSDNYPIEANIQKERYEFWKMLRDKSFINEEKYRRLIRKDRFTDEEQAAFINRQLVETSQGTKVIADILQQSFTNTDIVYVKARNVSDFRKRMNELKCRVVNDFHHAQDAYLNIVVGNVYDTKFTKNPLNFIKEYRKNPKQYAYHLDKMFEYDVERNGIKAWEQTNGTSIKIVKNVMKRHTPLVTKMSYEKNGGFYDENIIGAKNIQKVDGKGYLPIKGSDTQLSNVCKYGGFSKISGSYFFLVEHEKKGKKIRTIEEIPMYLKNKLKTDAQLQEYCITQLGLTQPFIKMSSIKTYSLLRIDGFYGYITGRSNDRLLISSAVQMVLSKKEVEYVRKIEKIYNSQISEEQMEKMEEINCEKNLQLYKRLKEKHTQGIYGKRPNSIGKQLLEGEEKFQKLSAKNQIYVLLQVLKISTRENQGVDLTHIGGKGRAGTSAINKNITDRSECLLISQSVTGLYEKVVDLKTV